MYTVSGKVFRFADLDISGTYSYADYLNWEFSEPVELIKGKVFPMDIPPAVHQRQAQRICYRLYHSLKRQHNAVFSPPFVVRLPGRSPGNENIDTVVQPDFCVITDQGMIDEKGSLGVPAIVVEVLSCADNVKEIKDKFEVYENAGIPEYWIVLPVSYIFLKYSLDQNDKYRTSRLLTFGDRVTTPLLPDLTLDLDEIFEELY